MPLLTFHQEPSLFPVCMQRLHFTLAALLAEKPKADDAEAPCFTRPCCFSLCLPRLQMVADQLVERFVASGLMLKEWDRVKLHATVMNTLFRKDPSTYRAFILAAKRI